MSAPAGPSAAQPGRLLAALARRLPLPLRVVADDPAPWRAAGADAATPDLTGREIAAGSLVLACDLAARSRKEREALVASCWASVPVGAALVLVTPNPDALPPAERATVLDRRAAKRLLRPCGRVKKWRDQPFAWLAFSAVKRAGDQGDLDHEERLRLEVTADLCRGRVVELGCGHGDLAGLLLERGHEVVGVDRAARKVEDAARRFPAGTFLAADILDAPLAPGSFDTVLLPEVLEHVDAATGRLMLDRAFSLVAPGGRLIVTVPNEDSIPHPNHVQHFDRAALEALLRPYGDAVLCVEQPYKWLLAWVARS